MPDVKEIYEIMRSKTASDQKLVAHAYDFARKAHEGHKRFSGEPYFNHLFATAKNLATFGMDAQAIAAGFLHDTLEDADVSESVLQKEFGSEILFMVEGVTKLGKLKYRGLERHTESLRKLFISTAQDLRVIIVKLADRLHNVSTLEYVREDKRQRIAMETLEIYAPLANRLGMGRLKGELEEFSFPYAYPHEYQMVKKLLKEKSKENEEHLEKVYRSIKKLFVENDMQNAEVSYRIKGTYSLYRKLLRVNMEIEKAYDISAVRVIVPTVGDCYKVLGLVHSVWRPLPGRIKDYIAFPKPNGYQSIHTTLFIGDGGIVEIQIRTHEMHREAQYGIASHISYKEGVKLHRGDKLSKRLDWIRQLIEWQKNVHESGEFLDTLKMDFFKDRVFVFTPKHDVIDLPVGSSAIDLAYAIHSDIGDHISGAKVNGKFVSIDTELENGDIVEIITKRTSKPTKKWLQHAKTTLAKRHIRQSLQKEQ